MERVPASGIGFLRWSSNLTRWEIALEARLEGERRDEGRWRERLMEV